MHPLTHGNLQAAAGDARLVQKALEKQDIVTAVQIMKRMIVRLESAVDIERHLSLKEKTG